MSGESFAAARRLWRARGLIARLVRRDIATRYRTSLIGTFWTIVQPLVLLATYTVVFGAFFRMRWPGLVNDGLGSFAVMLFCGLIPFNVFSECILRSPSTVVEVPAYVKRIVFPLELLPAGLVGSVLVHAAVSLGVLVIAAALAGLGPAWTIVFAPVVLLPLAFLSLGIAWALASLGVFVRDLGYALGLVTQVLLFLTPIFYPPDVVPASLRWAVTLNPLAWIVMNLRRVVLGGQMPEWAGLLLWSLVSFLVAALGYAWFQKTRPAFADVL